MNNSSAELHRQISFQVVSRVSSCRSTEVYSPGWHLALMLQASNHDEGSEKEILVAFYVMLLMWNVGVILWNLPIWYITGRFQCGANSFQRMESSTLILTSRMQIKCAWCSPILDSSELAVPVPPAKSCLTAWNLATHAISWIGHPQVVVIKLLLLAHLHHGHQRY